VSPFVQIAWASAIEDAYAAEAQDLNAIGIWSQSRDSTYWFDESGGDRHGTLGNSPTWSASGGPRASIPGYFSFNGTTQRVSMGDSSALRLQAHTMVWWERGGTQADSLATRIGKGDQSYAVRRNGADNALRYYVRTGAGSERVVDITSKSTTDWQMLIARWHPAGSNSTLSLHEVDSNGDEQTLGTATVNEITLGASTDAFAVGAQDNAGTWRRWFQGDIAGVLLFNYALSTAQMEALWTASGQS